MHIYIATTRFNDETWEQNCDWRIKNEWRGCVYGTPTRMKDNIPTGGLVVMLEMNNDKNKIVGLGLVKNSLALDRRYAIYNWGNYNRYIYRSHYRIDRQDLSREEEMIMLVLDMLLFKGQRHLKRGQGITCLPKWIIENKHVDFEKIIREMFVSRFK
jgi:hypothetical protein